MGYIIFVSLLVLECYPIEKYNFDFGWFWIIILIIALANVAKEVNDL